MKFADCETYKSTSDYYRAYVEEHPELEQKTKETMLQASHSMGILSQCTQDDLDDMFDNGLFNDTVKAYCLKAMEGASIDDNTKQAILANLADAFYELTAKEAREALDKKNKKPHLVLLSVN